jgi:hypothetical protein
MRPMLGFLEARAREPLEIMLSEALRFKLALTE